MPQAQVLTFETKM